MTLPTTTKRKFAIAGNVGETVLFWTGRAKVSRWTAEERRARTWATRETAEKWLPKVEKGRAMDALRVLEVAP